MTKRDDRTPRIRPRIDKGDTCSNLLWHQVQAKRSRAFIVASLFTHCRDLFTHHKNLHLNSSYRDSAPKMPTKTATREKLGNGLRYLSACVCQKVEKKGRTSLNEVADEIIREVVASQEGGPGKKPHNQKNIRRRVYDALNVLIALGIIEKTKHSLVWKGFPSNSRRNLELLLVRKQWYFLLS